VELFQGGLLSTLTIHDNTTSITTIIGRSSTATRKIKHRSYRKQSWTLSMQLNSGADSLLMLKKKKAIHFKTTFNFLLGKHAA